MTTQAWDNGRAYLETSSLWKHGCKLRYVDYSVAGLVHSIRVLVWRVHVLHERLNQMHDTTEVEQVGDDQQWCGSPGWGLQPGMRPHLERLGEPCVPPSALAVTGSGGGTVTTTTATTSAANAGEHEFLARPGCRCEPPVCQTSPVERDCDYALCEARSRVHPWALKCLRQCVHWSRL